MAYGIGVDLRLTRAQQWPNARVVNIHTPVSAYICFQYCFVLHTTTLLVTSQSFKTSDGSTVGRANWGR